MTTPPDTSGELSKLKEKLADIEHQRWSDWQKWCHKVIRENVPRTDELEAVLARWDRQIEVPYELLTDSEKASDMEQVDRYWSLIEDYITSQVSEQVRLARIDEFYTVTEMIKKSGISMTPRHLAVKLAERLKDHVGTLHKSNIGDSKNG